MLQKKVHRVNFKGRPPLCFLEPKAIILQGEHKVFPWLQTFTVLQENYVEYKPFLLPLLKLVSQILCHVFIVMLQLHNLLVSKWRQWRRKPSEFCGITKQNHRSQCSGNSEMSTDNLRQTLKASKRGNSQFVETGSVGDLNRSGRPSVREQVERNWLSIRHSPCNRRSTCWSVLMSCKKLLEFHLKKNKCFYTT